MSISTIEGKIGAVYKTEDFFAAIAVLGDELDYVKFVGLYNEDDLIESMSDAYKRRWTTTIPSSCLRGKTW